MTLSQRVKQPKQNSGGKGACQVCLRKELAVFFQSSTRAQARGGWRCWGGGMELSVDTFVGKVELFSVFGLRSHLGTVH